jgi:site-specific DNA-methyltransferase (adenine-specific)
MKFNMEQINGVTIYCGDAMEILPNLPMVDLILTDPPYKLTSGGHTGEMGGVFAPVAYDNSGSIVECNIDWPDFMPLLSAILPHGHAYVMANNRNVQAMLNAAESAGFGFHNLLVWDKITCTPNRWYAKNLEFIGFFYKGKAIYINDCSSKQLIRCPQVDVSQHPTEKPVALFEHYIVNSTEKNALVCDPFAGSGTTGVAAVKTGRRAILIEKSPEWYEVICRRVERASKQLYMF